jgi:chromosome segregation ATPase
MDKPNTWDEWRQSKSFKTTRQRIAELKDERTELEWEYRIAMRDVQEAEQKETECWNKLSQNKKALKELGEGVDFDWD